jgi:hypothetical protein
LNPIQSQGTIRVILTIPPIHSNLAGPFWNIKSSFFGALTGEKIWVVLVDGILYCYDTPFETTLLRKIDVKRVMKLEAVVYDKLDIKIDGVTIRLSSGESLLCNKYYLKYHIYRIHFLIK